MNKNPWRKWILPLIFTVIAIPLLYYAMFPPLNIRSPELWSYIFILLVIFFGIRFLLCRKLHKGDPSEEQTVINLAGREVRIPSSSKKFKKYAKLGGVIIGVLLIAVIGIWVSSSEIFHATAYHNQLQVEEGNFQQDIAEIPFSQIPVVDKDTAKKLGDRKLGEVVSLVSQFDISDIYTQINYNNTPTRVSPLVYNDIIKWFTNQAQGIPYYIRINMATQATDLVELKDPMKYGMSEHFNRYLMRHVQMKYPTALLDNPQFEIDEEGSPYWVIPIYTYKIGLLGGKDVIGIALVNAVTGETTRYDIQDVPQWIDNAYPAALLNYQADNWGKYSNGWFNSIFGQRDVISTTEGYNSLAINDDLWMYTGLTSVNGDQSNIGFILVNMRTKETKYYKINGADEESAMRSAEGKVQEKKYNSTFPILINVADQPTYFMSLKDAAGLIKQYAFVSVQNYQIVGVGDSVSAARDSYIQQLQTSGASNVSAEAQEISGTVSSITSAVRDGDTYYYFTLSDNPNVIYIASVKLENKLPLMKAGDAVDITYTQTTDTVRSVSEITVQ